MPYRGELEPVRAEFDAGMSVLELGCGTGRLSRELLSYGCIVTAVDSSPEMLSFVPSEARVVQGSIEALNLAQEFDIVLLAAGLINHCDADVRAAFIHSAAKHTGKNGKFLVERQDPAWLASAREGVTRNDAEMSTAVESVTRMGSTVGMTVRYTGPSDTWTHSFVLEALDDASFENELKVGGFGPVRWLDARRRWASARLGRVA